MTSNIKTGKENGQKNKKQIDPKEMKNRKKMKSYIISLASFFTLSPLSTCNTRQSLATTPCTIVALSLATVDTLKIFLAMISTLAACPSSPTRPSTIIGITPASNAFTLFLPQADGSWVGVVLLATKEEILVVMRTHAKFICCFYRCDDDTHTKELLVGGKIDSWKIPSSQSDSLNQWAERSRFRVDDYLVWKYESGKDSVLEVTREAYANCNISNPIKEYSDGKTKVKLDHPGPFYFISGAKGHCEKGQKVIVVVMSPRHTISPAPSPAPFEGPAVAPTSSATMLQFGFVTVVGVLTTYVGFLM
ncbi:hypothetical protein Fmac_011459 [Flemingia macrophylla]|uniref:Phytocyanin domain-containing protein n=1 Tax=Flemingia macrophylla TaxID=520843 RepID=A0ABD1MMG7_9FABA